MANLMETIVGGDCAGNAQFPHAPEGWTPAGAIEAAKLEGLTLTDDHWQTLRALQRYYARHEATSLNLREMHDALEEMFHRAGGLRHLYRIFPGGPIAQGCRIAGLKAPAGASDKGFGSVA